MKRSQINELIIHADHFIRSFGYVLPPFSGWTPQKFKHRQRQASALITSRCGWDITDFGGGDFDRLGLVLFTLRNGQLADLRAGHGMCYAEKLLISRQDQLCPMHTHFLKTEDIINRGGALLVVEVYGSEPDGSFSDLQGGTVLRDGISYDYSAGEKLRLEPGESVTLQPGDWHAFWAEGGDVLIGEVSTVNDDGADNVFRDPLPRFADIEEDTAAFRLLVSDYEHCFSSVQAPKA